MNKVWNKNRRKVYADKKLAGICVYSSCKKPAVKDRVHCEFHLLASSAMVIKGYQKKKKSKICTYGGCYNKPAKGKVQCIYHHKLSIARSDKRELELRIEVMTQYCGGTPRCQCPGCDTTFMGFLQIDHVNGGGNKHRSDANYPLRGDHLLIWIRKNNYPKDFQVLCANCNSPGGKGARKYCPLRGKPHHE